MGGLATVDASEQVTSSDPLESYGVGLPLMAVYGLDEDGMLRRDFKGPGNGSTYGILTYYTFTNRSTERVPNAFLSWKRGCEVVRLPLVW